MKFKDLKPNDLFKCNIPDYKGFIFKVLEPGMILKYGENADRIYGNLKNLYRSHLFSPDEEVEKIGSYVGNIV